MSWDALCAAENTPCKAMEKFVLVMLAKTASDDGAMVWASISTLAFKCGCSDQSVRNHIKSLQGRGYISHVHERPGRPTVYILDIPKMVADDCKPLKDFDPSKVLTPQKSVGDPSKVLTPPLKSFDPINIDKQEQTKKEGKPSESECREYALHLGLPAEEGSAMYHHFEMVGWVYGKSKHPVKSWKAALVTWKKNYQPSLKVENGGKFQEPDQDGGDFLRNWRPS